MQFTKEAINLSFGKTTEERLQYISNEFFGTSILTDAKNFLMAAMPDITNLFGNVRSYMSNLLSSSSEELKEYRIFVVRNRDLLMYEITPTALECFIKAFNGTVCDYDHWKYFMRCLSGAERMTGIKEGDFTYKGKVNSEY